MKRIIKVTEAQLRMTEGEAFKYLDTTDDTTPFNGQSTVTAAGKLNGEENAEPVFADRIAKQRTPQAWARYRMYGNLGFNRPSAARMEEGVSAKQGDANGDKIDDFYTRVGRIGQGNGIDSLTDGDNENNLSVIPQGIDKKVDILISEMERLNVKQQAMVLNKIIETFDFSKLPELLKSQLIQEIDPNSIKKFD